MSAGLPSLVIFHPKDRRLWILDSTLGLGGALLAVDGDQVVELKSGPELFAGKVDFLGYGNGFYYDTISERPVLWVNRYPGELDLFAYDGACFRPLEQTASVPTTDDDAFAFDPARGVFVHFLATTVPEVNPERAKQGGVIVREMDSNGVWKDVGGLVEPSLKFELFAGWDGARSQLIVFDDDGHTAGYDGRRFTPIEEMPGMPWKPFTTAQTPRERRLVYLQANRDTTPGTSLAILGDAGWRRHSTAGLLRFGGGAHDPVHERTVFWNPSHGAGHHERLFVALQDDRLEPTGPINWNLDDGTSTAGPAIFFATNAFISTSAKDRADAVPRLAAVRGDVLEPLPALPAPLLSLASYPDGLLAIGWSGEVFRLAGDAWQRIAEAPPEFKERSGANVAWHPTRPEATVVGGEMIDELGAPFPTDTWRWREGGWEKLSTTGKPAVRQGHAGVNALTEEIVFLGGKLKNYKESERTWICDGKKWKSFPTTFDGPEPWLHGACLAWDPGSHQLLLIAYSGGPDRRLSGYAHRGEGRWQLVASSDWQTVAAHAFSGADRVVYQLATTKLATYQISRWDLNTVDLPRPAETAAPKSSRKKAGKEALAEAPPVAAAVWLRYQDDASDKFWFAAREGAGYRARWGRRGAKEQSKAYSFPTDERAIAEYEKAVRKKLGEGYEHAPEGEAAATIPGLTAWYLTGPVKNGEDQYRGPPPLFAEGEWPTCQCGARLRYVLTFHRHPERLPLKHHAALGVFFCSANCDAVARAEGATWAVPLREEVLPKTPRAGLGFKYKRVFEPDPDKEDNAPSLGAEPKVGGHPVWLEDDRPPPSCSVCHAAMRFVAQLDSMEPAPTSAPDDKFDIAAGMAYVFLCPDEHEGRWCWEQ